MLSLLHAKRSHKLLAKQILCKEGFDLIVYEELNIRGPKLKCEVK